jgi:hypothetical protein
MEEQVEEDEEHSALVEEKMKEVAFQIVVVLLESMMKQVAEELDYYHDSNLVKQFYLKDQHQRRNDNEKKMIHKADNQPKKIKEEGQEVVEDSRMNYDYDKDPGFHFYEDSNHNNRRHHQQFHFFLIDYNHHEKEGNRTDRRFLERGRERGESKTTTKEEETVNNKVLPVV